MTTGLPEDPLLRSLVRLARAQVSRRSLLAGAGVGLGALALSACAPTTSGPPTAAKDVSAGDDRVTWANWPSYLDEDSRRHHPTLDAFTRSTGIKATYSAAVDDNNAYYSKVKSKLVAGQDIGADTVCLTDWMVSRWIRSGYTQVLDHDNIPNIAYLQLKLRGVDYDPGRVHSLPWLGGIAGLAWNTEEVPYGLRTVDDLWAPALKGRVGVLSELRDTVGLIMMEQGVDVSGPFTDADYTSAIDVFREQVTRDQIRAVKGASYVDDLRKGSTVAAIAWSGDIATLNAEAGDKWRFAIPDAGGTLWYDDFLVPITATHKTNAEKLMNWYYEPKIAARVAASVNYIPPVDGAQQAAAAIDPQLAANQLVFPSDDTLARTKIFRTLTDDEEKRFGAAFQSVLLGT